MRLQSIGSAVIFSAFFSEGTITSKYSFQKTIYELDHTGDRRQGLPTTQLCTEEYGVQGKAANCTEAVSKSGPFVRREIDRWIIGRFGGRSNQT